MCLAMNADKLKPEERCASTSNRNYEGRQGAGGRTHLVSPKMAAAAALYGKFVVEPSTRIIGKVSSGSTSLDVDSTVGFGSTGELYFRYSDDSIGVSSYSSKSLTQFYGVTEINSEIADATVVGINTFAYGRSKLDQDEFIQVRINSVLGEFNLKSCKLLTLFNARFGIATVQKVWEASPHKQEKKNDKINAKRFSSKTFGRKRKNKSIRGS